MSEETETAKEHQEAFDKCVDLLSEHLEAGMIIGTYIDGDGITRKTSQSWGNDFAVSALVKLAAIEVEIISDYCSCPTEEED